MFFSALKRHDQNRTRAARDLGISRRTLHRKLKLYAEEERGRGNGPEQETAPHAP
jgi:DNA-binding NtrC family response regulator